MATALGQPQGYVAPNFAGMAGQKFHQAQQIPAFPASPLAGGPAATQGGEFVDVQGRDVIVQTQFAEGYPAGFGGGDPMAIDFGGYGQDQVGPHYFDVHGGLVYLQGERLFGNLEAFTAPGAGNPDRFLDPAGDSDEFEPGWHVAFRYDIGALAVLEAAYMGLYDFGFADSVNSADVAPGGAPSALVSVFNNFGAGAPIAGIDQGITHSVDFEADFQSTEINYRRYWVGVNPRVSGTYLVGARYLRYTDSFQFNSEGVVGAASETVSLEWNNENDMVGFHFGGDAWLGLRQGLRIGVEGTAGVYNNRYKFNNSGTFSADAATAPVGVVVIEDFSNAAEGNQVAFATEADASIVADILPSWSLSGGYQVLYLNSLATVGGNINQGAIGAGLRSTQSSLLFHGFHAELEYIW
ncbi:MAG: BBP7 family outer membrane beta-barrel protein [Planctomycetota bacterium]